MFTKAIVRPPSANFSEGLTKAGLGPPSFASAVEQHSAYCEALERCGLELIKLQPEPQYPDSTFVEDTAILIEGFNGDVPGLAVITRPGAESRRGETTEIRSVVSRFCSQVFSIEAPGTLDGGDICQVGSHFFIGISERTNETGAQQLVSILTPRGYTGSFIDIREIDGLLHLKSGMGSLGEKRVVITQALAGKMPRDFDLILVPANEEYSANCIKVNEHVLVPSGYKSLAAALADRGYQVIELEMNEFQKMDGGLSCLSLRF
ncbi:MAG TPA: arginine deiminase family protein [Pyrinomonadaceae bacterium]|nr:arginine deiminase family protein [Pyrinomonadaceae bacterium]